MSSMQELMAQMKAKKAQISQQANGNPVKPVDAVAARAANPISIQDTMDKLDSVKDKPIDYIGETIESQPHKLDISTEGQILFSRIDKLQVAMEKEIPEYASILHTIHKALSKDDELTHLLDDSQIGILIRAMKLRKNVVLVEEKKKASAKKPLSKTTLDDIL
jgi:hypothetical protein